MESLFVPLLLLALAIALLFGEVFFSSGMMALVAGIVYLASVVWAFSAAGPTVGLLFFLVSLTGTAVTVVAVVHWFPRSSVGRAFFVRPPRADGVMSERKVLQGLVGRVGRAGCRMLPGGIVRLEGKSYDAISEGPAIDVGEAVEVVGVRERMLIVRPSRRQPPVIGGIQAADETTASAESPFDSLVIDPFDEPT